LSERQVDTRAQVKISFSGDWEAAHKAADATARTAAAMNTRIESNRHKGKAVLHELKGAIHDKVLLTGPSADIYFANYQRHERGG
jgi:hypothetical protein